MTVREIVRQYLIEHGYDGLYSENGQCGCSLPDILECDRAGTGLCKPGFKVDDLSGELGFLIVSKEDLLEIEDVIYRRAVELVFSGENDKSTGTEIRAILENEFGPAALARTFGEG